MLVYIPGQAVGLEQPPQPPVNIEYVTALLHDVAEYGIGEPPHTAAAVLLALGPLKIENDGAVQDDQ